MDRTLLRFSKWPKKSIGKYSELRLIHLSANFHLNRSYRSELCSGKQTDWFLVKLLSIWRILRSILYRSVFITPWHAWDDVQYTSINKMVSHLCQVSVLPTSWICSVISFRLNWFQYQYLECINFLITSFTTLKTVCLTYVRSANLDL